MRPLVALCLVIAFAAILLFTLFSVGSDDAPRASPSAPFAGNRASSDPMAIPGAGAVAPAAAGEDALSPIAQEREEIAAPLHMFDNALVGTVRDPEGTPVAGVRLTLEARKLFDGGLGDVRRTLGRDAATDDGQRTAVTDEQGRYRIRELEPGPYSLVATHPEYSRSRSLLGVSHRGETTFDVTLKAGVMIQGYVRSSNGAPIPRATVELLRSNLDALFVPSPLGALAEDAETQATDSNGYYRFTNVTADRDLHLTARASGYGTQTNRHIDVDPMQDLHSFDFRMEPGQAIAGRVLTGAETPVAGALVVLFGYQEPQSLMAQATTSADGRFKVVDLVPGSYFLKVEAHGFGVAQLHSVEAPSLEIAVRMTENGGVRGLVVGPDGAPVTRFAAALHPYIEQSKTFGRADAPPTPFDAPDGAFSLSGGVVGPCVVRVEAKGFAATVSHPLEVVSGTVTEGVVVELGRGGTITGRVIDSATGEPLAGVTVSTQDNRYMDNILTRMASQVSVRRTTPLEARTDSKGYFELELLTPETYQIVVKHPRYAGQVKDDIAVVPGKATDVGSLELEAGAVVQGKVVDQRGQPMIGAVVKISPSGATRFSAETVTGSDGTYAILNVPPGSYWILASRNPESANPFQDIGDMQNSKVEIRVRPGGEHTQDIFLTSN